jgi:hypothetical protein
MRKITPRPVVILLSMLIAACSSSGPLVAERLDMRTGVTVLNATRPLVFYRDSSGRAAHARDFVYLGPVEVNNMGTSSYYLWLGIWSTMRDDDRFSEQRDGFESIVLYADGEPLPLEVAGWTPDSIGVSEHVYVKPVASAADAYYRVTIDQVRLIAMARDIELRTGLAYSDSYRLWDEQSTPSAALREFVGRAYD